MKRPKRSASHKDMKIKLTRLLVKKYGFENKFLIKETIESFVNNARPAELFSVGVIQCKIDNEIQKILTKKKKAVPQKKKLDLLNGILIWI